MLKISVFLIVAIMSLPGAAYAQATKPAEAVKPATTQAADLSGVASTAQFFLEALVKDDAVAAQGAMVTEGKSGDAMKATLEYVTQSNTLRREAARRFGKEAESRLPNPAAEMLQLLKQSQVVETGDVATLLIKWEGEKKVPWALLKKVGGHWKVAAIGGIQSQGNGPKEPATLLKRYANAIASVAGEVKSGKYVNVNEVQDALNEKMASSAQGHE